MELDGLNAYNQALIEMLNTVDRAFKLADEIDDLSLKILSLVVNISYKKEVNEAGIGRDR